MSTLEIKIPGSFTDPASAPLFTFDPLVTKGSLWLIDPTHPTLPWDAGVPSSGAAVPNLLSLQPEMLPDGLSGLVPSFTYQTDGLLTGTFGKVERSTKGGLHIIVAQTDQGGDYWTHTTSKYWAAISHTTGVGLGSGSDPYQLYMYGTNGTDGANQHSYYLSTWTRFTRASKDTVTENWHAYLSNYNSATNKFNVALVNNYAYHQPGGSSGSTVNRLGYSKQVSQGNAFNAVASTTHWGGAPAAATDIVSVPFLGGHAGQPNYYSTAKQAEPSLILYRSYCEDLTVSGRTYEQVSEIDRYLYTKEVLTPGGRYYGDTYTDPTTIP